MLSLIDDFINYDLVDMPEKEDGKDLRVETLQKRRNILRVLVSGSSSPLALPLLYSIANGYVFGKEVQLIIHFYDFTKLLMRHAKALEAELSMGGFKLLVDVVLSNKPSVSFKDIDFAILLEPKRIDEEFVPVPEIKLICQQYRFLGCALNHHAKKSVKTIIVGKNVNTKVLICSLFAPSVPTQNFTGLSCHFANRITVQLAEMFKVARELVSGVHVWGIDTIDTSSSSYMERNQTTSSSSYMERNQTTSSSSYMERNQTKSINDVMNVVQYFLKETKTKDIWDQFSLCLVKDIKRHITALINGTTEPLPMVTLSGGCYGIDPGLFVSLPVIVDESRNICIIKDLEIHTDVQKKLWSDLDKLKKDKMDILKFVAAHNQYKFIRQDFT